MRALIVCIFAAIACLPTTPAAQPDAVLLVDDVLDASAEHFPSILRSLAERRAAAGRVLAADGAFDLVFAADGFDRVQGFWDGGVINTEVKQNLRPLGAQIYGGYRISEGEFPIYEDINFTNTGGEAKVGAIFSLLRDRSIDQRRFNVRDANLALAAADFEVLLTKIGVQRRARLAYWRWVAAGRQLKVYENLLRIAEAREAGLEEQVRSGARAAIFVTENLQNITRRQRLVVEARRDFETAANALSFYYRDEKGAPVVPERGRLPSDDLAVSMERPTDIGVTVAGALAERPELSILRTALSRAEARRSLSQNELNPRLDLNAEVSHDFGEVGLGGETRDSTDVIVGFRFSVPLQRREARGRLRAAEADMAAVRQRRREAADRIELEIRNILINLDTSEELAEVARREVDQSLTMQRAERDRFQAGASDFFLLNVREETAADARIRLIIAELEIAIAEADFDAATVNLPGLGLTDTPVIN